MIPGASAGVNSKDLHDVAATALATEKLKEPIDVSNLAPNQHKRSELFLRSRYELDTSFTPGTAMCYCTFNYELLAEIIRRISGLGLDEFPRRRIFEPLGMSDASYKMEERFLNRLVKQGPDLPFGPAAENVIGRSVINLDDERGQDMPSGGGGVACTAHDLAIFGQMFANDGRYGDIEILTRPTIDVMTRNQPEGISSWYQGEILPEVSYGFGWHVHGNRPYRHMNGTLPAHGSYGHSGLGGSRFWVDPTNETVGAFLSVCTEVDTDTGEQKTEFDLFQNMVTAALAD